MAGKLLHPGKGAQTPNPIRVSRGSAVQVMLSPPREFGREDPPKHPFWGAV